MKIPFDGTDQAKKSVPKLISLKNSYDPTSYRNISKAISTGLNITDNQFITKDTYYSPQDDDEDTSNKFHYINFEIPIFLKDIS